MGRGDGRGVTWAKAVFRHRAGEPWWLPPEWEQELRGTSQTHETQEAWSDLILAWAEGEEGPFTVGQVLMEALGVPAEGMNRFRCRPGWGGYWRRPDSRSAALVVTGSAPGIGNSPTGRTGGEAGLVGGFSVVVQPPLWWMQVGPAVQPRAVAQDGPSKDWPHTQMMGRSNVHPLPRSGAHDIGKGEQEQPPPSPPRIALLSCHECPVYPRFQFTLALEYDRILYPPSPSAGCQCPMTS